MKDKYAIFKNAASLGIVVGLWVLYALMAADVVTLLEGLTVVVFIAALTLFIEDAMEKAFVNPKLFTWQYLLLGLFVLITDTLWLWFAACATWIQFALRGVLMLAAAAGTFCWYWFFYRASVMSPEEIIIKNLTKAYKKAAKAFPALDDEGVRNALKEVLFCRLEGDSMEGDLLTDKPFVTGYRTYNMLNSSSDLSAAEQSAAMTNINTYINALIAKRTKENTSV